VGRHTVEPDGGAQQAQRHEPQSVPRAKLNWQGSGGFSVDASVRIEAEE